MQLSFAPNNMVTNSAPLKSFSISEKCSFQGFFEVLRHFMVPWIFRGEDSTLNDSFQTDFESSGNNTLLKDHIFSLNSFKDFP